MLADAVETDDIIKQSPSRNLAKQGTEELSFLRQLRFWSKHKCRASLHEKDGLTVPTQNGNALRISLILPGYHPHRAAQGVLLSLGEAVNRIMEPVHARGMKSQETGREPKQQDDEVEPVRSQPLHVVE